MKSFIFSLYHVAWFVLFGIQCPDRTGKQNEMKNITAPAPLYIPESFLANCLALVRKLSEKDYFTEDVNALIEFEGHWLPRPGRDHQLLRLYLLLAAMDFVSQKSLSRENFYTGGKKPVIRIQTGRSSDYADEGMVETSLSYFVNNILTTSQKEELLKSVVISEVVGYSSVIAECDATAEEKIKLLTNIYSSYMQAGSPVKHTKLRKLSSTDNKSLYLNITWNPELMTNLVEELAVNVSPSALQQAA